MTAGKNIMLGTAGHVDHGKTSLVKLLTGCDTDRLAEEKKRGLTIELGFAPCRMADENIVGIVDVPGHVNFIRNMVAGAHGIDVVMLVVAADDGVMPQTREHLDILTLMGVRRGLIALTKVDLVDEEMLALVIDDIRKYVHGTFLADAKICPISNITGQGFDGFFAALNEQVAACEPHKSSGLYRQWIERSFNIKGFGAVVSGIPTSGEVRVGDRLRLLPGGQTGRVRGLEVYGRKADLGRAGECVALNIDGIDHEHLSRGCVLCESDIFEAVAMVEADLSLLPSVPKPLKDYTEVHLHIGTGETVAHVAMLEGKALQPGQNGMVQLRLADPLGIAAGERFVVRASVAGAAGGQATTIGGGLILGTSNIRLRRNRQWTLESLAARRAAVDSPPAWVELNLKEAGRPLSPDGMVRLAQMPLAAVEQLVGSLVKEGKAVDVGGAFVHAELLEQTGRTICENLRQFHDTNPSRIGMETAELKAALGEDTDAKVFDAALGRLLAAGAVEKQGTVISLAGRGAKISEKDRLLAEKIEKTLAVAGLQPPLPDDLASTAGIDRRKAEEMLRLLEDAGRVVRLDEKVAMHADAIAAAKKVVLDLFSRGGGFTTMEFRDALGVSRKFAVPLLDYFDTVKLTVRSGSRRTPGAAAK